MKITNHKLVMNPTTFKWVLVEISYPPYERRVVDPKELVDWDEDRFRSQMEACGYGGFVDAYYEQEGLTLNVR